MCYLKNLQDPRWNADQTQRENVGERQNLCNYESSSVSNMRDYLLFFQKNIQDQVKL